MDQAEQPPQPESLSTGPSSLVSIVIPIYNEVELIEEVLRRVRALPFDKQLILVDDCSTDGTAEILDRENPDPIRSFCVTIETEARARRSERA